MISNEPTTAERIDSLVKEKSLLANEAAKLDKLLALRNDPVFHELIIEGFCTTEAADYVRTSVNPSLDKEGQEHALAMAQAAGHFLVWLQIQMNKANNAVTNIARIDEELQEIHRGE